MMIPLPPNKLIRKKNGLNVLNPDYLAWKQQYGGVEHKSLHRSKSIIDKITVNVTVVQGKDLTAKDRNVFGKRTSSDPYVSVYHTFSSLINLPSSKQHKQQQQQQTKLGQTATVKKNLSPSWNYTIPTALSIPYTHQNENHKLVFKIFDEDKLSSGDCMGVVEIPIAFQESSSAAAAVWYDVPKTSAKNASGKIQIQIHKSLHRMEGMTPYC